MLFFVIESSKTKNIIDKNIKGEPNIFSNVLIQNEIDYIPKVSVIISINKVEHLIKYIEMIRNQTLKEIEIIIVDVSSTYNSFDSFKMFANKDKRITLIKKENLPENVSRNIGLTLAKGEYLFFVDLEYSFKFNMLEEMYEKISKTKSDIIICQSQSIRLDIYFNKKLHNNLQMELIPNKTTFTAIDISKNFFQIFEGCISDKLFKRDFILFNNITFSNIKNFNVYQFTYIALILAKSITIKKKILVNQINETKKSSSFIRKKDIEQVLFSLYTIKSCLKETDLYNLLKNSFRLMKIKLFINLLKMSDKNSKQFLFNLFHEKLNSWKNLEHSQFFSNIYSALHYAKYQKIFPSINIAYIISGDYLELFLISLASILINAEYENINILIFYNNINQNDLKKINELKYIRFFTLQLLYVPDIYFKNYPYIEIDFFLNILNKISYNDKILYLRFNTVVRKSLLPLWEINMNNILVAGVEDILQSKDIGKSNNIDLKDNFCSDDAVLLFNIKEWKKYKLYFIFFGNYIKNNVYKTNKNFLNIITDRKKINLNLKFNYMKLTNINICKIDSKNLILYKQKNPHILQISKIEFNNSICKNELTNDIFQYYTILNKLNHLQINIPIVLSADNKYEPYLYTTMVSILENQYKNTFYSFYVLVPSNFEKINENEILKLNNKYKCYIHFIYIKKTFANIRMFIPHISFPTYYRLLIGDILPKEIDKCIYLDVDLCIVKDLSDLFNIDMKDNYIAGVLSPKYYFYKEEHCKRLNLSSMIQYINAGMLLMNLKQIRMDNMTQKFIKLTEKNFASQDQDILNVACYGKILTLKPKYNLQVVRLFEKNNSYLRDLYRKEEIIQAKRSPYIIHFSAKKKPWNSIGINLEKYWLDTGKKTPYFDNFIRSREKIYKSELKNFYYKKRKKKLDFDKPTSFNEKIQWLKLYDSTPIKTQLTDKYLVREWVSEKIGRKYLIPLLGVYDSFNEIDFKKLPNQFVIKLNHGKKYNIIVKNKTQLNLTKTESKIEDWMDENYAYINGLELQYRDIKPKIIIEKYINDSTGGLYNYKIFCFNGKPNFIFIDNNMGFSKKKRNLYDLNWNQLPYKINSNYSTFPSPKKPKCLKEMIKLASILSKNFIYVRVDFYIIDDILLFDKMDFTSSSGIEDISPKVFEKRLCKLIKLPKLVYNIDNGEYYEKRKKILVNPFYIVLFFLSMKIFCKYKIFQ